MRLLFRIEPFYYQIAAESIALSKVPDTMYYQIRTATSNAIGFFIRSRISDAIMFSMYRANL
jgi:hypothetical protein